MKESYGEGLASHTGPESCGGARKGDGEALTGERAGRVLSRERDLTPGRRRRGGRRKATSGASLSRDAVESRAVRDPEHARTHLAREPGEPVVARGGWRGGPHREVQGRTPMMNGHGQSDRPVVPTKSPNNAGEPAAEGMEGRGLAKGNLSQQNAPRTQSRDGARSALERVREAAERDKTGAVHGAAAPRLQRRASAGGVLRAEAGRRAGDRRGDVGALRGGPRGEPRGPVRTAEARGVSSEAGQAGVHPQGRRAAAAAGHPHAGRQARPARDGRRC